MRATVITILLMLTYPASSSASAPKCPDPHTQALMNLWVYAMTSLPSDRMTPDARRVYQAIIVRAVRPVDKGILEAVCLETVGLMYTTYGLQDMQQQSMWYEGCPEDTLDRYLAKQEYLDRPDTHEDPVSDYLPVVRVAPVYPKKALQAGLGGNVTIEMTVTKSGKVRRPRIVESSDEVFNKAALQAIKKFRYNARRKDGKPVATEGVIATITFAHPDEQEPDDCPDLGEPKLLPDEELEKWSKTENSVETPGS